MNAKAIARAARKIESGRMNRAREVRTRAEDKPVATVAVLPHRPGRRSVIVDYGIAEANACYDVLKCIQDKRSPRPETIRALEGLCRYVTLDWMQSIGRVGASKESAGRV